MTVSITFGTLMGAIDSSVVNVALPHMQAAVGATIQEIARNVMANFKETQIGATRPGQRASVSVDAYGHRSFLAHVESLSWGTGARFSLLPPENATGNFVKAVQRVPVRIAFDRPPDVSRKRR